MRWLKTLVEPVFHRFGLEVVPRWRLARSCEVSLVSSIIDRYQIACVLDVGANVGQFRDFLRDLVKYRGPVLSFEPQAHCVAKLRGRAVADPQWKIIAEALGAVEEARALHVMKSDLFTSMLAPDAGEVPHLAAMNTVVETCEVRTRRLDDVLAGHFGSEVPEPLFLKVDTQGFDLEVLKGAPETLRRTAAVQLEASVLPIYRQMPDMIEALSMLRASGFDPVEAFPVSRDRALRTIEFDIVFISRKFAHQVVEETEGRTPV